MFKGSITALITPFKNGEVDEEGFQSFVDWQINAIKANEGPKAQS